MDSTLSFRGSLLKSTLKDEIERAGTLTKFKKLITKWDLFWDAKACQCLIRN